MISIDTLTLFLTWRCDLACAHCGFSCGPGRREVMDPAFARECIDIAAARGGMRMVAYSGGEPFLLYDEMRELLARSHAHGLDGGAVTNCGWARTQRLADARLREMRRLGLVEIIVSVDDYHLHHVPLSNVRRVVDAALGEGVRVGVNVLAVRDSEVRAQDVPSLLRVSRKVHRDPARMWIRESSPVRAGRAARRAGTDGAITWGPGDLADRPCHFVIRNAVVTPEGEVYACCGFGDASPRSPASIARCGSAQTTPLARILDRVTCDLALNIIAAAGPWALVRMAAKENPHLALPERFVSACELCGLIASDPPLRAAVARALRRAKAGVREQRT